MEGAEGGYGGEGAPPRGQGEGVEDLLRPPPQRQGKEEKTRGKHIPDLSHHGGGVGVYLLNRHGRRARRHKAKKDGRSGAASANGGQGRGKGTRGRVGGKGKGWQGQ